MGELPVGPGCRRTTLLEAHRQGILLSVRELDRTLGPSRLLTHPNITTTHEVGQAGGRDYLALEHVEGRTLQELVRRGPLPY